MADEASPSPSGLGHLLSPLIPYSPDRREEHQRGLLGSLPFVFLLPLLPVVAPTASVRVVHPSGQREAPRDIPASPTQPAPRRSRADINAVEGHEETFLPVPPGDTRLPRRSTHQQPVHPLAISGHEFATTSARALARDSASRLPRLTRRAPAGAHRSIWTAETPPPLPASPSRPSRSRFQRRAIPNSLPG